MKTCFGTESLFWFDCGVGDKNSTKQSLAKPSTTHILIPIPMMTQSDSYFSHDYSALLGKKEISIPLKSISMPYLTPPKNLD
jgi:hypothetical protein